MKSYVIHQDDPSKDMKIMAGLAVLSTALAEHNIAIRMDPRTTSRVYLAPLIDGLPDSLLHALGVSLAIASNRRGHMELHCCGTPRTGSGLVRSWRPNLLMRVVPNLLDAYCCGSVLRVAHRVNRVFRVLDDYPEPERGEVVHELRLGLGHTMIRVANDPRIRDDMFWLRPLEVSSHPPFACTAAVTSFAASVDVPQVAHDILSFPKHAVIYRWLQNPDNVHALRQEYRNYRELCDKRGYTHFYEDKTETK